MRTDGCRSNAKLERLLDWLLAVYKLAFPVLVSSFCLPGCSACSVSNLTHLASH